MELDYATIIEHMADGLQDAPCLYYGDQTLSWQQYEDRAARIAHSLADQGLGKDSKVGLLLYNCCEYMEAMLAAFKIRAIPININYRYVDEELTYLLADCEAEALIFHSSLGHHVAAIQEKLPALKVLISVDDGVAPINGALDYQRLVKTLPPAARIERSSNDSFMLYTGGTTGMPKGVEYNIGDMCNQMLQTGPMFFGIRAAESLPELVSMAIDRREKSQTFVSLPASPLMHTAGILNSGILIQLLGGAMVILKSRSFDPRELWSAVERFKVNHMVVVGDTFVKPMLTAIEEDRLKGVSYDLCSLKAIVSSGVIFCQQSKVKLLELADLMIVDAVGATEGGMAAQVSNRQLPPTDTASFTALPTTEIFDESYHRLERGTGEVGYIGMGGTLPQGYYKDAEKTAKTFRIIDGQRFGFTGDMGSIETDGTLVFKGRSSGCINTGGEKVYPEEVEEVIKRHPNVIDCLVVGLADDRFGAKVTAVVSLHKPVEDIKAELMAFTEKYLARYKLPRLVKVTATIKRGPNGKADYKWAKALLEQE